MRTREPTELRDWISGFLVSSILQFLIIGCLTALFVSQEPAQTWPVIALVVVGELGVTACFCSCIVRQFHKAHVPDWLTTVVVGYIVSHLGILDVLYRSPFSSHYPPVPGQSTLAWMELTLRVDLIAIIALSTAMLLERRIRKVYQSGLTANPSASQSQGANLAH